MHQASEVSSARSRRKMPAGILVAAILAAGTVLSTTLLATVTEPRTLRELAARAALIVRGSITDVRVVAVPGRGVESVATVAVERLLKGEYEAFVSVRVPGGLDGRYRHVTIGAPVLRPNQQSVFFLQRGADNGWRPVGLSAGVVRVLSEPATGRRLVYPAVIQGVTASPGILFRGDDRRRSLAVEEFEALVALVMIAPAVSAEAAP